MKYGLSRIKRRLKHFYDEIPLYRTQEKINYSLREPFLKITDTEKRDPNYVIPILKTIPKFNDLKKESTDLASIPQYDSISRTKSLSDLAVAVEGNESLGPCGPAIARFHALIPPTYAR